MAGKSFFEGEDGAVTVDWVVLTAGLVGLGLATMSVVSTGVQDVSGDVEGQLSARIISTAFQGSLTHFMQTFDPACGQGTDAAVSALVAAHAQTPTVIDQSVVDNWGAVIPAGVDTWDDAQILDSIAQTQSAADGNGGVENIPVNQQIGYVTVHCVAAERGLSY